MSSPRCPLHTGLEVVLALAAATLVAKAAARAIGASPGVPSRASKGHAVPVELKGCDSSVKERLEVATELALKAGAAIKECIDGEKTITNKGMHDLVTQTDKANEKLIFDTLKARFPKDLFIGEEASGDAGSIPELTSAPTWIVDPIDGTTNFVHGFPMTCVSIAFTKGCEVQLGVVFDPCAGELYHCVRGKGAYVNGRKVRSSGCSDLTQAVVITEYGYQRDPEAIATMMAATERVLKKVRAVRQVGSGVLDLLLVGCGRADAVYAGVAGEGWKPWDYAAGWLFAEEAGATVMEVDGSAFHVFADSVLCAATAPLAEELRTTVTVP